MPKNRARLQQPLDAIIFDCDGTLSAIEGIDLLAEHNGVGRQVKELTARAMGETGLTPELYRQRLELVRPTMEQVQTLGIEYILNMTPDTEEVVRILQKSGKQVFIVSAGLYPAVLQLGEKLNIPNGNIFAVDISYDNDGNYRNFDQVSLLTTNNGKREIVYELKKQYSHIGFVGDGLNDISVMDLVTRFVGYGGNCYRKHIEEKCDYYVKEASMASVLPFLLTEDESKNYPDEFNS